MKEKLFYLFSGIIITILCLPTMASALIYNPDITDLSAYEGDVNITGDVDITGNLDVSGDITFTGVQLVGGITSPLELGDSTNVATTTLQTDVNGYFSISPDGNRVMVGTTTMTELFNVAGDVTIASGTDNVTLNLKAAGNKDLAEIDFYAPTDTIRSRIRTNPNAASALEFFDDNDNVRNFKLNTSGGIEFNIETGEEFNIESKAAGGGADKNFIFYAKSDGTIGLSTSTPDSTLTIGAVAGTNPLQITSTTNAVMLSMDDKADVILNGDIQLGDEKSILTGKTNADILSIKAWDTNLGGTGGYDEFARLTVGTAPSWQWYHSFRMRDNIVIEIGNNIDTTLKWDTSQGEDTLYWGLGNTANSIIFGNKTDSGTDMEHDAQSAATAFFHSPDETKPLEFLQVGYVATTTDLTYGLIDTGYGSLVLDSASSTVGIGTSTPDSVLTVQAVDGIVAFKVSSSTNADMLTLTDKGLFGIATSSPSSTLDVNGSVAKAVNIVNSATYTITATDYFVDVLYTQTDTATTTLPDAGTCIGREYVICDVGYNASSNNLVVEVTGDDTIGGTSLDTRAILATDGECIEVHAASGTLWKIH